MNFERLSQNSVTNITLENALRKLRKKAIQIRSQN